MLSFISYSLDPHAVGRDSRISFSLIYFLENIKHPTSSKMSPVISENNVIVKKSSKIFENSFLKNGISKAKFYFFENRNYDLKKIENLCFSVKFR